MPLYEYKCPDDHIFTQICSVEARLGPFHCPHCGGVGQKVILHAPRVFGDYEGYLSPSTGRWVEGRRQREDDLRRSGCRPYEAGEREAAQKVVDARERQLDAAIDEAVDRTLSDLTL